MAEMAENEEEEVPESEEVSEDAEVPEMPSEVRQHTHTRPCTHPRTLAHLMASHTCTLDGTWHLGGGNKPITHSHTHPSHT